ncbi:PP2C family protein-serine/threonine phosphatase [Cellulomonas dongxiuzhuiae]|uniref:Serine/threonine-protein phosphatase n=1 Tax=Cellulomonas dongxiuzhuiae TaxID=2819979 RepID=A0ABX8GMB4_9CELL|nr:PP2C family protein-serine/threonine phosphatase [Cellulomonas dongxiuzhuiae]MBO3095986.1 serine/threonine-protein phosphatase [Cellulomonas dongxiuzhuiae]QWC17274.1 serine/threonine-protein phosphatase [Cellulomonas dongxiuzhuiae]
MTTSRPGAPTGWAWRLLAGWAAGPQPLVAAVLCLLAVLYGAAVQWRPAWFAASGLVLVLLVGAFVLRWRWLLVLVSLVVLLTAGLAVSGVVNAGEAAVPVLACGAVVIFGVERERLGLQGAPGALMLVDLRDRLAAGGRLPALPPVWQVDAEVRSAHGAAFSGDFVVAHRDGASFEVVLVDVSGKGQAAGVRALQLQGALGGLLGALPFEGFLPAANAYLLSQGWDEGFATAAHLAVDLTTGTFRVATAGHPPPAVLHAGSGRIDVLDPPGGVALGVVKDMRPGVVGGVLLRGDAIVLYTDGLVEAPGRDVDQGIDRLLGVVETVVAARPGSAHEVLAGVRAAEDDDRAVVVVRRR